VTIPYDDLLIVRDGNVEKMQSKILDAGVVHTVTVDDVHIARAFSM
jgi:hypothetical protein